MWHADRKRQLYKKMETHCLLFSLTNNRFNRHFRSRNPSKSNVLTSSMFQLLESTKNSLSKVCQKIQ